MSSGKTAASIAIAFSLISVLTCMFFVPILVGKISAIHSMLRQDMDEFKVVSNDVWREIQIGKAGGTYKQLKQSRTKRQVGQCQCGSDNFCPPGPPGEPGFAGSDGEPGKAGQNGEGGLPGVAAPITPPPDNRCRVCPPGSVGPPGANGSKGPAGNNGNPGEKGSDGNPGRPGSDGPPGSVGNGGRPGNNGAQGQPGREGQAGGKGEAGTPGRAGNPGAKGPPGPQGANANSGRPGPPGLQGAAGDKGNDGRPGDNGFGGPNGPPGEDAQYCPCPRRTSLKQSFGGQDTSGASVVLKSVGSGSSDESEDVVVSKVIPDSVIVNNKLAEVIDDNNVLDDDEGYGKGLFENGEGPPIKVFEPQVERDNEGQSSQQSVGAAWDFQSVPLVSESSLKLSNNNQQQAPAAPAAAAAATPAWESAAEQHDGEEAHEDVAVHQVVPEQQVVHDEEQETHAVTLQAGAAAEHQQQAFPAEAEHIPRYNLFTLDGNEKDVVFEQVGRHSWNTWKEDSQEHEEIVAGSVEKEAKKKQ